MCESICLMLRWMTAGESHGEALTAVMEGVPAGVRITSEDIRAALARRRLGHGRGARQSFERDELRVLGGIRHGSTIGSPVALQIGNSEWPKWSTVMSADPVDPHELLVDAGTGDEREIARNRPLTRPRPGHADLPGMLKYDLDEARPVLERASARETAARVALGALAEAVLAQVAGIGLVSHVVRIGTVSLPDDVPAHVSADRRLDARLAAALMGLQAVKGVEIGDGFAEAARRGSAAHDEIVSARDGEITRSTNRAGGVEGGVSNGSELRVRAAFKPISTVPRALRTVDLATGEAATGLHQRSDVCAVVPGAVIAQAMTALVLADLLLDKTGGDSVAEARRNLQAYLARIAQRTHW